MRAVYLNGAFVADTDAKVSIFDRGLLFADGIYEVAGVLDGKLIDFDSHMARLDRSLREMGMTAPMSHAEILSVMREMVSRNAVDEGMVYMQITRGTQERDFVFTDGLTPTVFMFTQATSAKERDKAEKGVSLMSCPDLRWKRRDIKTVGLLAQSLAKTTAKRAGFDEALMLEDGFVTECGCTSFHIVTGGAVVTRPLSNAILSGCTRKALLRLAEQGGIAIRERACRLVEAYEADEAFITGASSHVQPVVKIDGQEIGNGTPGPVVRRLKEIYLDFARETAV